VAESEGPEAATAENASGEDGKAQSGKNGDAAEKGSKKFCADEDAALRVSKLPLVEQDGKNGAEQNGAETGENESGSEPESGGAEAAVVVRGVGLHERHCLRAWMLPRGARCEI